LVNKKAVAYRHIFGELKQVALERNSVFSPLMIMSDFESGVLPVIKSEVSDKCHKEESSLFFTYSFLVSFIKTSCLFLSFLSGYISSNNTLGNAARLFR